MTNLNDIDMTDAFNMYAISNTPLFLLKQLKGLPVTREVAKSFSGEAILQALQEMALIEETESADYVRPYVCLVALSQLSDIAYLRAAGEIKGSEKWDWFKYLHQVLMDTYYPSIITSSSTPSVSRLGPSISNLSTSSLDIQNIILSR